MGKVVNIAGRSIGRGYPCYIILEGGVNFDDFEEAKELIDTGIKIGGDCMKFQTFHADTVTAKNNPLEDGRGTIDQYEELVESEEKQTEEFQKNLFDYCKKKNFTAFTTPSHYTDVDMLERIANPPAYKLGSDELTNIPFLKYIARLKKPMIISSGASYLSEIDAAIRAIREEGNNDIILLHCVTRYPAKAEDMNLRAMKTLINAFDVPVGLSDHTMTTSIALAAVTMGATVIEKHFTCHREKPGPDNFFSMMPDEMQAIIKGVREIEVALGSPYKKVINTENEMRKVFKKSIFAVKDIVAGEKLTKKNVDNLRPGGGLKPELLPQIIGMKVTRNIKAGEQINWDCFK